MPVIIGELVWGFDNSLSRFLWRIMSLIFYVTVSNLNYRFSGEKVVKACVAQGTNYVDISGEPQFLESMQMKYHEEAEKKGIYIIGSCGFDSIPSDLGQMVKLMKIKG